jgi:hypothetical protein
LVREIDIVIINMNATANTTTNGIITLTIPDDGITNQNKNVSIALETSAIQFNAVSDVDFSSGVITHTITLASILVSILYITF